MFLDFVVYSVAIGAVGFSGLFAAGPYVVPTILVADFLLTSLLGVTPGRFVMGIRVLRPDGRPPGLMAGAIRTALVVTTGLVGVYMFSMRVTDEDAAQYRLWWDTIVGTQVVRVGRVKERPKLDPRSAVLLGFRVGEEDLVANAAGRQSSSQRFRIFIRATLYAAGFVIAALFPLGAVFEMLAQGFSFGSLVTVVVGFLVAAGVFVYSDEIWRDAISGRVIQLDGVPRKGIERAEMIDGGAWRFPYLMLEGEHKLGRRAFDAIETGRRYRLYVLPASRRCVGAIPLD